MTILLSWWLVGWSLLSWMCCDFEDDDAGIWCYRPVWTAAGWSFPWSYWTSHQRKVNIMSNVFMWKFQASWLKLFNWWFPLETCHKEKFPYAYSTDLLSKKNCSKHFLILYACPSTYLYCNYCYVYCMLMLRYYPCSAWQSACSEVRCTSILMSVSLSVGVIKSTDGCVCTKQGHLSESDYEKLHGCEWLQNCGGCGGHGTSGRSIQMLKPES